MKTRCVQCGKEFEYDGFCCPTMCDECTKEWAASGKNYTYADRRYVARQMGADKVHCLICNEEIQLTDREFELLFCTGIATRLVCDKCKQAVMKMREHLKEGK